MKRILLFLVLVTFTSCSKPFETLRTFTFYSMGMMVRVSLEWNEMKHAEEVRSIFEKFDRLWSKFRKESDVTKLNDNAGKYVYVSEETIDLIKKASEMCEKTEGYFNPGIYEIYRKWEKGESLLSVPEIVSDCNFAEVKENTVKVKKGRGIDLDGIAVGYVLDRVREMFEKKGIKWGIVDAGGDIFVAGGGEMWKAGIENPVNPGNVLIAAEVEGFEFTCTSGSYRNFFHTTSGDLPKIIDPFTGFPSRDFLSVTVFAHKGVECDALSTAIFAGGERGLGGILKRWEGKMKFIVIRSSWR